MKLTSHPRARRVPKQLTADPERFIVPGLQVKHLSEFLDLVREVRNHWSCNQHPKELAHRRTMSAHATKRRKREEAARRRLVAAQP